ncbi:MULTISPECIES: hypothetical protein [unclassified Nonomuraea]|uniref:hypothetical protein n=1 Tax=unclassified Nonomuraea TaxID=2593643 RepID=UPI00340B9F65
MIITDLRVLAELEADVTVPPQHVDLADPVGNEVAHGPIGSRFGSGSGWSRG